jgi:hypothetical protein
MLPRLTKLYYLYHFTSPTVRITDTAYTKLIWLENDLWERGE